MHSKRFTRKLLAFVLSFGCLASAFPAQALTLDPDGPGPQPPIGFNVLSFDWNISNVLYVDLFPLAQGGGTSVPVLAQGALGGFRGENNGFAGSGVGLGVDYEYTFVFHSTQSVGRLTNSLFELGNGGGGFINVYYDPSRNANALAGTGFDDGTLVLSAQVIAAPGGSFTITSFTSVLLDQFGGDNLSGQPTLELGGATVFSAVAQSINPAFFTNAPAPGFVSLSFNLSPFETPFVGVDPSAQFVGMSGLLDRGPVNGDPDAAGGPWDMQLQTDAQLSIQAQGIGDFVWEDLNGDGVQDSNEPGLPGATVTLFDCSGISPIPIGVPVTTDANGLYFFPVGAGMYTVQFTPPDSSFLFSTPAGGVTECFSLALNQVDLTRDAGLFRQGVITGFVWNDETRNDIQDGGEPGVSAVTVNLFVNGNPTPIATTATDQNGNYAFLNLNPGNYTVEVIAPAGFQFTLRDQGANDSLDSDVDPTTGRSDAIVLSSGDEADRDAGLFMTPPDEMAIVGNRVFEDLNANGIQDLGEPGIEGVTVSLFDCSSEPVQIGPSVTTGADGLYLFQNLPASMYQVQFELLPGYSFSPAKVGNDDTVDSDADQMTGLTPCVSIAINQMNLDLDVGMFLPAAIGGQVWNDLDQDGIQDDVPNTEPGLPGVTVELIACDENSTLIATTTTGSVGEYLFDNLVPGTYRVRFTSPPNFIFSPQNAGNDDALDSDANTATGETECIDLISGEIEDNVDAGLSQVLPAACIDIEKFTNGVDADAAPGPFLAVGGSVSWTYAVRNCGNVLLNNVVVSDDQGVAVSCPQTILDVGETINCTASGAVAAGQYENVGTAMGTDPLGQTVSDQDTSHYFGSERPSVLGDRVFADLNRNGIQDRSEPGIGGVQVNLLTADGALVATTTTRDNGWYQFPNLAAGSFILEFVAPEGFVFSPQNAFDNFGDDQLDSDADPQGRTGVITLGMGQTDLSWDAGLFLNAALCPPEPPLPALDFEDDADDRTLMVGQVIDDEWARLGVNVLVQDPINQPAIIFDSGAPTGGNFDLGSPHQDFAGPGVGGGGGFGQPGKNPNPLGKVLILSASGDLSNPQATASGGQISFTFDPPRPIASVRLLQGEISFGLAGVVSAFDAEGGLIMQQEATDLGPNSAHNIKLGAPDVARLDVSLFGNGAIAAVEFGLDFCPAAVGDFVWEDRNRNGVREDDELGVFGVRVNLLSETGGLVATTTTDLSGNYGFGGLLPGFYRLEFIRPEDFILSPRDQGGDDTIDSDPEPNTDRTVLFVLPPGVVDSTKDSGLIRKE